MVRIPRIILNFLTFSDVHSLYDGVLSTQVPIQIVKQTLTAITSRTNAAYHFCDTPTVRSENIPIFVQPEHVQTELWLDETRKWSEGEQSNICVDTSNIL